MLSRAAFRAAQRSSTTTSSLVSRRGFQTTRANLSSPYHYPEGPYSNIPFNPKSKWFPVQFWTFCFVGFAAPFGIAGKPPCLLFSVYKK
jgi:cytochrome c oxidase subunit 7c